jgi:hypothetical protein
VLQPIRNPLTGAVHRASINLPDGFDAREAERVSSRCWRVGAIRQRHVNTDGILTDAAHGPHGVVQAASYLRGHA